MCYKMRYLQWVAPNRMSVIMTGQTCWLDEKSWLSYAIGSCLSWFEYPHGFEVNLVFIVDAQLNPHYGYTLSSRYRQVCPALSLILLLISPHRNATLLLKVLIWPHSSDPSYNLSISFTLRNNHDRTDTCVASIRMKNCRSKHSFSLLNTYSCEPCIFHDNFLLFLCV